jgi:hypothetical protein
MADPLQPSEKLNASLASEKMAEPQPSEAEVVKALVEVEQATNGGATKGTTPNAEFGGASTPQDSRAANSGLLIGIMVIGAAAVLGLSLGLVRAFQGGKKELSNIAVTRDGGATGGSQRAARTIDATAQGELQDLLARAVTGDSGAAERVLAGASDWTGKVKRTPRTEQLITAGLNSNDPQAREASLQALLALDNIPRDESGLATLEQAVGNPGQRRWALWMLGAIGNRGVDPVHTAKIIGSYLTDTEVNVRAAAVDGLSLVGTDETIPMLLDRFRNDPSPVVQERAACDLAQSGMYTHEQRMVAASSLVGWVDDSLLTAQQRGWTTQALGDIAGKNFGADASAWRSWYESTR